MMKRIWLAPVAAARVATSPASNPSLGSLELSWASSRNVFGPAPGMPWPDHISTDGALVIREVARAIAQFASHGCFVGIAEYAGTEMVAHQFRDRLHLIGRAE